MPFPAMDPWFGKAAVLAASVALVAMALITAGRLGPEERMMA